MNAVTYKPNKSDRLLSLGQALCSGMILMMLHWGECAHVSQRSPLLTRWLTVDKWMFGEVRVTTLLTYFWRQWSKYRRNSILSFRFPQKKNKAPTNQSHIPPSLGTLTQHYWKIIWLILIVLFYFLLRLHGLLVFYWSGFHFNVLFVF